MTKRETDFRDDDLGIARRAVSLLAGHPPGREQLPEEIDFGILFGSTGEDGFMKPLAWLALTRWEDAQRSSLDAPPMDPIGDPTEPKIIEALLLQTRQREAAVAEKKANEELREGKLRVDTAARFWREASEKRADGYARIPMQFLTGEHQGVLAEVLAAQEAVKRAFERMDRAMRRLAPTSQSESFPSLLGLAKTERNRLLNMQALRLSEAGHTLEEIAYVMGWDFGEPEHVRDRTRKRLEEARLGVAAPDERG